MNKDKQIDEMACEKCLHFEACRIAFRNSQDLGIYDCTEEEYFSTTYDCDYYISKNDYRKASEIFEEIEKIIDKHYNKHIFGSNDLEDEEKEAVINFSDDVTYDIAELKKKYIGEDTNVLTNTEDGECLSK